MAAVTCASLGDALAAGSRIGGTDVAPVGTDAAGPTSSEVESAPGPEMAPAAPIEAHLDDVGVMSVEQALALFAVTFAPLPGVEPANGVIEGADSMVLSTLSASRSALDVAQIEVFDVVIGGPGGAIGLPVAENGWAGRRPTGARSDLAVPIVFEAMTYFGDRLGRALTFPITLVELPASAGGVTYFGPGEAATAIQLLAYDGTGYDECLIRVNVDAPYEPATFKSQIGHEVFHCFQFVHGAERPGWIHEGQAAYAGEEFAGGTDQSSTWWQNWLAHPTRSISARTYDAIGLYSLTAAAGADPYGYFDELYRTSDLAVIRSAVPGIDDVWGSSYANESAWGWPFVATGPGAPADERPERVTLHLPLDGPAATFDRFPRPADQAAQVYQFSTTGQVLTVDPQGAAGGLRFEDGTSMTFSTGAVTDYCTDPGGCVCPGDTTSAAMPVNGSRGFVGLGPTTAPYPILVAKSLEAWCREAEPPAPPTTVAGRCEVGTWRSTRLSLPPIPEIPTTYAGGDGIAVSFGADGSFSADYDGMSAATARGEIPGGPVAVLSVRFAGTLAGTWSAGSDDRLVVTADASAVRVTSTLTTGGGTNRILDTSLGELVAASGAAAFTVTFCEGDHLEIASAFSEGSVTMVLTRS